MADKSWIAELSEILDPDQVVTHPASLTAYACDAYTLEESLPRAVILPKNRDQVADVVRILHKHEIPFLARGAGTSLSGGATPLEGSVVLHFSRMNRILSIDVQNGILECEPGVVNAHISRALKDHGFFYAPDPSSQQACTIGGNFAENSGGPHCLKYGVTVNHILQAEVVLSDGRMVTVGNLSGYAESIDFLGLLIGSEGTLGVMTRVWLRILPSPEANSTTAALFDGMTEASQAVSSIIAHGIIPSALEMMDALTVHAVEQGAYPVGYPDDVAAVLLIELDGPRDEVEQDALRVAEVLNRFHVRDVRNPASEEERTLWWANRKTAFGAMGLISPRYYVQDGVIPRSRLPEALQAIHQISEYYDIRIANVFHAGDGNLHPLLLYDDKNPAQVARVKEAGSAVLKVCVDLGGTISGEHGIGIEKIHDMLEQFSPAELSAQMAVKESFDPYGRLNPGKLIPEPARCGQESVTELSS